MKFKDEMGSSLVCVKHNILFIAFADCVSKQNAQFVFDRVKTLLENLSSSCWGIVVSTLGDLNLSNEVSEIVSEIIQYNLQRGCCCEAFVLPNSEHMAVMMKLRCDDGAEIPIEEINFATSEQAIEYLQQFIEIVSSTLNEQANDLKI
jgi:hypothetical protein